MRRLSVLFGLLAALASPARATWYEASTAHFVIDADTTEPRIRAFAERLERFDHALRVLYGVRDDPAQKSNRVHVYATGQATILALCKGCPQETMGFYHPRLGGSVIFTSALSGGGSKNEVRDLWLDPQEVLLHEYSHHFMYSNFEGGMPRWFGEGFADFNANTLFDPDGTVVIGLPANYRAYGLRVLDSMSARELMAPSAMTLRNPRSLEQVYGRGWLLVHYLMLNDAQRPKLEAYEKAIGDGTPSLKAAEQAFGNLAKLDAALDKYRDGKLNTPLAIKPGPAPQVEVRPLTAGAAAMMAVHMRSTAGVDSRAADQIWPEAERRAAPFADDPVVQVELAEAEFDANRLDQADAAAERALKADPGNVVAMLYRGRVAARRLTQAKSHDPAGWAAARRWFVRANRTDTEATQPLLLYYQSYLAEGVKPPEIAVDGLAKAQMMAPEAEDARWLLARARIEAGDGKAAKALLQPIAYAPHGKGDQNVAMTIIEKIDAGDVKAAAAAFPGAEDQKVPAS